MKQIMKSDSSTYQTEIRSTSGDLYLSIGHHGPAVENEWMALRIYFDQRAQAAFPPDFQ
jgi:hypothetical protein